MLRIPCRKEHTEGIEKQRNDISSQIKTNVLKRAISNQYSDLGAVHYSTDITSANKMFPFESAKARKKCFIRKTIKKK